MSTGMYTSTPPPVTGTLGLGGGDADMSLIDPQTRRLVGSAMLPLVGSVGGPVDSLIVHGH